MHIINYDNPPPIEELRMSNLTKSKMDNGRYTWEKKYSVVATYIATGSMRRTEKLSGVPTPTIENWRKLPWWEKMYEEIKNAETAELNTQLTKIINKSLSVIGDRLENGEVAYLKDGTSYRKEVGIKDAIRASSELLQRKIALEKNTVENVVSSTTVQDTLKALALEFARMTTPKKETIQLEEVEDAVYEERDT